MAQRDRPSAGSRLLFNQRLLAIDEWTTPIHLQVGL
jgi:hypothetical protein